MTTPMADTALGLIVVQMIVVLLLLLVVRSFGKFTDALLKVHDSNRVIMDQHVQIIQLLERHPLPDTEDAA